MKTEKPTTTASPPSYLEATYLSSSSAAAAEPHVPEDLKASHPRDAALDTKVTFKSSSSSASQRPPDNAQRARAPLHILESHAAINGDFFVVGAASSNSVIVPLGSVESLGTCTAAPHVSLRTSSSRIDVSIWVDSFAWGRPFDIDVTTTSSSIRLSVVSFWAISMTFMHRHSCSDTSNSVHAGAWTAHQLTLHDI